MSYIPTLLASLDTRLDELAAEISTLESARAALRTPTPATPPAAVAQNGAAQKRPRRPTPQTKTPAPKPSPPATVPKPELAPAAAKGSRSEAPKPRRRAAAKATPKKRSARSLPAEQLERLLADATSGLSAGAIAERAGAGYSRVLALLRQLEASGTVRRTGNRRSTLWLLITDEDRIAQRTAELERLVGARRDDRSQRRGRARAS
jgi:ribosomal protein S25